MRFYSAVTVAFFIATSGVSAQTKDYSVCSDMVREAAHNVGVSTSSYDYSSSLFDQYCREDGSVRSSNLNIGVVVKLIPIQFGLSTDEATVSNFCKTFSQDIKMHSATYNYNSQVVGESLTTARQCVDIINNGNLISHAIVTPDKLRLTVRAGNAQKVVINGIDPGNHVTCESKGNILRNTHWDVSTSYSVDANEGSYTVFCTRTPTNRPDLKDGSTFYGRASVIMSTSAGPYEIFWPDQHVEPERSAEKIAENIDALTKQLNALRSNLANNGTPTGEGATATNPFGGKDFGARDVSCPAGQYLAGETIHFGGTCHGTCDEDGGPIRSVVPICRKLVP